VNKIPGAVEESFYFEKERLVEGLTKLLEIGNEEI